MGYLDKDVAYAIVLSCEEILNGRLHGQFITDLVQGGSGNSMNTNANEVIANRANELMGGEKGKYDLVSPEDVNLNQDSYEVVLIAGKLSIIRLTKTAHRSQKIKQFLHRQNCGIQTFPL